MAKKTVSSQRSEIKHVKIIKMFKSSKTGSYRFSEEIMDKEKADEKLGE